MTSTTPTIDEFTKFLTKSGEHPQGVLEAIYSLNLKQHKLHYYLGLIFDFMADQTSQEGKQVYSLISPETDNDAVAILLTTTRPGGVVIYEMRTSRDLMDFDGAYPFDMYLYTLRANIRIAILALQRTDPKAYTRPCPEDDVEMSPLGRARQEAEDEIRKAQEEAPA